VIAPPSLREGRRLARALDELETATLVAAVRPPAGRVPRMQAMVSAVHTDYRRALAGSAEAPLRAGVESFADLRDRARRVRGQGPDFFRATAADRQGGAPPPRTIEPDVVDRIARYADDLRNIVEDAGTPRGAFRRAFAATPPRHDAPFVRAGRLQPPDARRIRLAHELGTKPLTAWTVVRVSGDMASAFSRAGEPALVGFHGVLAADSLGYWRGLMTNVAQLVSTLLGLVLGLIHVGSRPEIPSAEEFWARLRRAFTASHRWVYRETWELIGQGGKVFETGTNAALRSLLQPDGTIVTHARAEVLAEIPLTQRHTTDINAWLCRLLEGWKAANDLLQLLAVMILVVVAGAELVGFGWDDIWHAVLRLVIAALAALLARSAVAAGIRYLIFRAR
jgi:hypothetical protein